VRTIRLLMIVGVLMFSFVAARCGSSSTPSSPSPTPAPAPAPAPTPAPTPAPAPTPTPAPTPAALSSLSLSSGSVVGQSQPIGTVTLTAAASAGGAIVRLESSNITVARVPSSVTVAAGATTATFVVDTATVDTRTTVTFTATFADLARTTTLAVILPRPRAIFTVTSPTQGQDACVLIESGLQLDCRLEGRASEGRIVRWHWTLEARERISANRPDSAFNEIDSECRFVNGASTSTDNAGTYINMTVMLEVTDRDGDQNTSSRTVKLYTNGNCGF
jgi:hypothetical protein